MNRFVAEFKPKSTDIAICGSMSHMQQWLPIIDKLRVIGFSVSTPELSERVDWSKMSDEETTAQKGRLIRRHIANIATAQVVFIANFDKNGVKNYIGSNSFLEMGAAFLFEKPIYLLNPVPHQDNREEILALEPIVINQDLSRIIL